MLKSEMFTEEEKSARAYLNALHISVEEAGGLYSLWSERTARMNTVEVTKLGDALGITNKGIYSPNASVSLVKKTIKDLSKQNNCKNFDGLSADLNSNCDNFERQIDSVWLNYAKDEVVKHGEDLKVPTAKQIKDGFVAGEYDDILKTNYALLRDGETELLLSNYQFKVETNQIDYSAEQ